MAKLYFRYGAMGSSKTANALMVRYNYLEKGKNPLLLKPAIENRDGETKIVSRIGLSAECETIESFFGRLRCATIPKNMLKEYDVIIVDESQFLKTGDIDNLARIVDECQITVICYGLRTDFTGHLFEGSKRLMEIADVIEEIPTICWCGKKAHFNARIKNRKVVKTGELIEMGGNESYVSLCRKHFMQGELK